MQPHSSGSELRRLLLMFPGLVNRGKQPSFGTLSSSVCVRGSVNDSKEGLLFVSASFEMLIPVRVELSCLPQRRGESALANSKFPLYPVQQPG